MNSPNDVQFDDDMEVVVRAYRKGLVVHCYRFLGSFEDAEEAAQEAFVRAWRSRDGFRGDSSTKTWLSSIATRVCLDLLRTRKRRIVPASLDVASKPSHRARLQIRTTYHASGVDSFPDVALDDPVVASTLERFVLARQTSDIDALVDTLSEDVRLAMPPVPSWYSGRDDVLAFIARFVAPLARFSLTPAYLNAQPGFTMSLDRRDGKSGRAANRSVLNVRQERPAPLWRILVDQRNPPCCRPMPSSRSSSRSA